MKKIDNNFIIIGMGIGLLSLASLFFFYMLFLSGTIDWNQNKPIIEIIHLEIMKSSRPLIVFVAWMVGLLMGLKSWIKLSKVPKYFTYLDENKFIQVPIFLEEDKIIHEDVTSIKKSFFPLYGNAPRWMHPIVLAPFALLFVQPTYLIMYIFKLCYWVWNKFVLKKETKFMIFSYIIIFKNESELLNINLLKNSDYAMLDTYLDEKFKKHIEDLDINSTLLRVKKAS